MFTFQIKHYLWKKKENEKNNTEVEQTEIKIQKLKWNRSPVIVITN